MCPSNGEDTRPTMGLQWSSMSEAFCRTGEIELCYETFGAPEDPTLLLIMGLGTQMVAWHEDFCAMLADRGFYVVRFDNRDCGRSTHLTAVRSPTLWELIRRDSRVAGYTLSDMADDAVGLLDGLGRANAHVVGASMGGMIAQVLAAHHPERVLTLTSIMSTTGHRWRGQPALRTYRYFIERRPGDRDAAIEHIVRFFHLIGSPGFERDDDTLRGIVGRSLERANGDGRGSGRQLAAIFASGDRTAELRTITAPTLVIHGTDDRLVRASGGRATARAIPGARLELIEGFGHDLPRGVWPRIVDSIVGLARSPAPAREAIRSS